MFERVCVCVLRAVLGVTGHISSELLPSICSRRCLEGMSPHREPFGPEDLDPSSQLLSEGGREHTPKPRWDLVALAASSALLGQFLSRSV